MMEALVLASSDAYNSFFIGLDDDDAQIDYNVYDAEISSSFIWDDASLRGTGTYDNNELDPMVWDLDTGLHTFTFYTREADTRLDKIVLKCACFSFSDLISKLEDWKQDMITLDQQPWAACPRTF